jgi:NAD(P)-dependent dehydrogenase (short-subunit alcohol dehydrogenase family)
MSEQRASAAARGARFSLDGRIAVVTGGSRGAGRSIAHVLGEHGATVYVTGRSTGSERTENLPGTIEATAEEVSARGGQGIAVRCDHTRDGDVEALFLRVEQERGRLDLLVNSAWGGYERHEGRGFVAPFWEQPARHWDGMFTAGLRAHLFAARAAAPMMIAQKQGLIVSVVAWAFGEYLGNLFYDVSKAATIRLAFALSKELAPHGVAALALAPGFMRTERVMAAHAAEPFDLSATESPEYLGRAVAHLAADHLIMKKSGLILTVGELAEEYGFTDLDSCRPPPFRL